MSEDEGGFLVQAAPVLGAAAGTFASTIGADMIGVPTKWAPWGTAAIGTVGAMTASGWLRQAAIGVAAAGASIGILRLVGILDDSGFFPIPLVHPRDASPPETAPSAPPPTETKPNGITRDELQKALGELSEKHAANMNELKQAYDTRLQELRSAYEARIGDITIGYEQRVRSQDDTISNLLRELRKAQAASMPRIVPRDAVPVEDTATEEESDATPPSNDEQAIATLPSAEALSRAEAIFALLTPAESTQLRQIIASMPPEAVTLAESHLAKLDPADAVEYLRSHLLTPRDAA